ncbi:MAG: hypothetical protein ACTTJS_05020 [Wolinella sp.]
MIKQILILTLLATISMAKHAQRWETHTTMNGEISALSLDSSQSRLAIGSSHGELAIISVESGKISLESRIYGAINSLAFVDSGVLIGEQIGGISQWDLTTNTIKKWRDLPINAGSVAKIATDKNSVAASLYGRKLWLFLDTKIHETNTKENLSAIYVHDGKLFALNVNGNLLSFSHDLKESEIITRHSGEIVSSTMCEDKIIAAKSNKQIIDFSLNTKQTIKQIGVMDFVITDLSCSKRGIFVGGSKGEVVLIGFDGKKIEHFNGLEGEWVRDVVVIGENLAIGISWEGKMILWEIL